MTQDNKFVDIDDKIHQITLKISEYICGHNMPGKLDEIKQMFKDTAKLYENSFLNRIDNMQNNITSEIASTYWNISIEKADEIIEIILQYNTTPDLGSFRLGYNVGNFKLLENAFKNNVIPLNTPYSTCCLNNAFAYIINKKRSGDYIINIIKLFITNGFNINNFYGNFINSWNSQVIIYLMSIITRPIDYMGEFIESFKHIPENYSFDDFKIIVHFMIDKLLTDKALNNKDHDGCTHMHYICKYYIKIQPNKLYQADYYEYFIQEMLLKDADISIKNNCQLTPLSWHPDECRPVDMKNRRIMHQRLHDIVEDVILDRKNAIRFVKKMSNFLLPDIANVVFDHRYKFDSNIHSNLAQASINSYLC